MAIQNRSLIGAEFDWYATRSGVVSYAPLGDHKLAYYASKGFGSNASLSKPLSQIEQEWLDSLGGTWEAACQNQTITPGISEDDCKMRFFTSVASGTNP